MAVLLNEKLPGELKNLIKECFIKYVIDETLNIML